MSSEILVCILQFLLVERINLLVLSKLHILRGRKVSENVQNKCSKSFQSKNIRPFLKSCLAQMEDDLLLNKYTLTYDLPELHFTGKGKKTNL